MCYCSLIESQEHRFCIYSYIVEQMSRPMGKPTICICENKGADQLRSYCEADQRLCFRNTDSTTPLLSKSKMPSSVTVQAGLCQTCSKTTLLGFPRGGSNAASYDARKPGFDGILLIRTLMIHFMCINKNKHSKH